MPDSAPAAPERRDPVPVLLAAAVALLAVATVATIALTWPGTRPGEAPPGQRLGTVLAEVRSVDDAECPVPDTSGCHRATVRILEGEDRGATSTFLVGDTASEVQVEPGDRVRLVKSQVEPGSVEGVEIEPYAFSDYDRRSALIWLAVLFAAVVVVAGRWRGLRALVGLAASVGVILGYIVPGLLAGEEAVVVACAGALAVMFLTIPLAHGWGLTTIAATLGTTGSLALTIALTLLFTELARLTGFASEEAAYLAASADQVSIRGLLLAGIVIATLGVLDDVTVTQASTVLALRHANPTLGFGQLFTRALSVGRDHITATVNTLVLAYAGASLPVLLVFAVADYPLVDALNGEAVAGEIVATLVGSIGLISAVPTTTALAALLALHVAPGEIDPHAGHVHG